MSSRPVDEKIVRLTLEHADFASAAKRAFSTINDLNRHFSGLNNVNLSGMESSVNTIAQRYTLLGNVVQEVYRRITNSIVDVGQNVVKSVTIDGMKDGWNEYELKMNSVRTILNGVKKDFNSEEEALRAVNAALNDLNHYSDKTIYSFSDMTSNIGKFTNAGVDLQTSVDAIKGVSNLAASAGANANEASRAMYNFSQALSSGSVRVMDWRSIETANMATQEFREELVQTALKLGTVVEQEGKYVTTTTNAQGKVSDLFDANTKFNDSLQHQWLTTEVLTETLSHYANDVNDMTEAERQNYEARLKSIGYTDEEIAKIEQLGIDAAKSATQVTTFTKMMDALKEAIGSGWAQTFEIIFGDLHEAIDLWTGINNVLSGLINSFSDMRNNYLQSWKDAGGRTALIQGLANIFSFLAKVLGTVSKAFREVFPPSNAEGLVAATKTFEHITEVLGPLGDLLESILVPAFTLFFRIVKAVLSPVKTLIGFLNGVANSVLGHAISGLGKLATKVSDVINKIKEGFSSNVLADSIKAIPEMFKTLFGAIKTAFGYIASGEFVPMIANAVTNFVQQFVATMSTLFTSAKTTATNVFNTVSAAVTEFSNRVRTAIGIVKDFALAVWNMLPEPVRNALMATAFVVASLVRSFGLFLKMKITQALQRMGMAIINATIGYENYLKVLKALQDWGVFNLPQLFKDIASAVLSGGYRRIPEILASFVNANPKLKALEENLRGVVSAFSSFGKNISLGKLDMERLYLDFMRINQAISIGNFKDIPKIIKSAIRHQPALFNMLTGIRDGFASISEGVKNTVEYFKDGKFMADVKDSYDRFMTSIEDHPGLYNMISNSVSKLTRSYQLLVGVLKIVKDHVVNVFSSIFDGDFSLEKLKTEIDELIESIKKLADDIFGDNETYARFKEHLKGLSELDFSNLQQFIPTLDQLRSIVTDPKFLGTLATVATAIGGYFGLKNASNSTSGIGNIFAILQNASKEKDSIDKVTTAASGFFSMLNSTAKKVGAVALLAFGLSMLADSLANLAKVDPVALLRAAGALVALGGALFLFASYLKADWKSLASVALVAFSMLAITVALKSLIGTIEKMGKLDSQVAADGLARILLFLGSMAGFAKLTKGSNLLSAAGGVAVMAVALTMLGASMMLISLLPLGAIVKGLGVLSAVLVVVGLFSRFGVGENGGSLLKSAAAIAIVSLSLIALAAGLKAIASLGSTFGDKLGVIANLGFALVAIGLIGAVLIALDYYSGKFKGAGQILAMAVAIGIVSLSMMAIAKALKKVAEIKSWGKMLAAAVALSGIVLALGFAAKMISKNWKSLIVLALLGPMLMGFAKGMEYLTKSASKWNSNTFIGLGTFLGVITGLSIGIMLLGQALNASGIGPALLMIAGAIGILALAFALGVFSVLAFVDAVENFNDEGGEKMAKNMDDLAEGVHKAAPKMADAAVDIITAFLKALAGQSGELIDGGLKVAITCIQGLAQALRDNEMELAWAIADVVVAMIEAFIIAIGALIIRFEAWLTGEDVNTAKADFEDIFGDIGKAGAEEMADKFFGWLKDNFTLDKLVRFFGKHWFGPGLWSNAFRLINGGQHLLGMDGILDEKQGSPLNGGLYRKFGNQKKASKKQPSGTGTPSNGIDTTDLQKQATQMVTDANEAGQQAVEDQNGIADYVLQKLEETLPQLSKSGVQGIATACTSMNSAAPKAGVAGTTMSKTFVVGMGGMISAAPRIGRSTVTNTSSSMRSQVNAEGFDQTGSNIGKGLVKGMASIMGAAIARAKDIIKNIKKAMDEEAEVASPSRLTYQTGMYMGLGLVNALIDMTSRAGLAGSQMVGAAIDGVKSTSQMIGSAINNALTMTLDTQPVITPVVDMSNINDLSNYGNLFPGTVSLRGVQNGTQTAPYISRIEVNVNIQTNGTETVDDIAAIAREQAQQVITTEVRKIAWR